MKAAVYHGPRDIRVEELPLPAIAADEVLVRVAACGICGSDLHLYRLGMFEALGRPVEGGRVMGHELAGEIAAVGASVREFSPGDRIAGDGVLVLLAAREGKVVVLVDQVVRARPGSGRRRRPGRASRQRLGQREGGGGDQDQAGKQAAFKHGSLPLGLEARRLAEL